jgi:hypothetical protein
LIKQLDRPNGFAPKSSKRKTTSFNQRQPGNFEKNFAAVLWSKGANSFTSKLRVSDVGDAYDLANNFGKYFARMLSTGKEPESINLSLPSGQSMRSALGGKPKYAACETFGRASGLAGVLATQVGAPPQWTDKQLQPQR